MQPSSWAARVPNAEVVGAGPAGEYSVNRRGVVAFMTGTEVFVGRPGELKRVAGLGDALADGSATIAGFEALDGDEDPAGVTINALGQAAFSAVLDNGESAVLLATRQGIERVPDRVEIDGEIVKAELDWPGITMDAVGRVSWEGMLPPPEGSESARGGLFVTGSLGRLVPVLVRGDVVDVDPSPSGEDLRTVVDVAGGLASNDEDGTRTLLSESGGVTALVSAFEDGSRGVLFATVPLPADTDGDLSVDAADRTAYLALLGAGEELADVNGSGDADFLDVLRYLLWYDAAVAVQD